MKLFKEGHITSYFPELKEEWTEFPKELVCAYEKSHILSCDTVVANELYVHADVKFI
jgi:hypothetical protein